MQYTSKVEGDVKERKGISGGAPIYHTWVVLSNNHPSQTARHSFSGFFFQFRLANPINIANANNPDPLPQLPAWSQLMAGEPKGGQKDKRGGALGSSFPGFPSRAVLGWWFDKITYVW